MTMRQQVRNNQPAEPTEYEIQLSEQEVDRIVDLVITRLNETQGSEEDEQLPGTIN